MARDRLRLGWRAFGGVAQDFGGAPMQRLTTALEQALISRILDERVPEAVMSSGPTSSAIRMSALVSRVSDDLSSALGAPDTA